MKTLPKIGAIGAALALTAAGLFGAATAGADTVNINAPLTTPPSALTLDMPVLSMTGSIPAPDGSKFVGSWDDTSGDLTGALTIANGSFTATVGGNTATIAFSFTEAPGGITNGSIDPSTNAVAFDDSQTFHITGITLGGNTLAVTDCSIGPVDMDYTGTYDPDTGKVDVTSAATSIGQATGTCDPIGADTINGVLANGTVASHVVFTAGVEPTTPTTAPPTSAAPTTTVPGKPNAPAAQPVAATPKYTG